MNIFGECAKSANEMCKKMWINNCSSTLTWSSESTVSGIISGFFSSLSFPSSSLLPILLSLGPGDPSPVVVPCDNSFRLKRLRRRPPHGNLNTTMMANAPITSAADSPITTESIGVKAIGARGRSVEKYKQSKCEIIHIKWNKSKMKCCERERPSNPKANENHIFHFQYKMMKSISIAISACINIVLSDILAIYVRICKCHAIFYLVIHGLHLA